LRSSSLKQAIFYPFGFAVVVRSNSEAVVGIAQDEWHAWQQAFDDPPIELTFQVRDNGGSGRPPAAVFHADRHLFAVVADANNFAMGDTRARIATAFLDPGAVDDRAYFTYHFLDAMAFQLITSLYLTPLHAASVARNGRAVLFCGDSGAGKSSLSYACARRGGENRWTFVSDDASHLLRRRAGSRRILGVPQQVRLRPDAPKLFPELAAFEPKMRGTGKLSLQIPTRVLAISTAPTAFVDTIVLPKRVVHAETRLEPIDKALVREHCAQWFYHWDLPILAEQEAAFEELLHGARTYSLEYSDLDSAVRLLDDIAE
jgi:hypothetical protein